MRPIFTIPIIALLLLAGAAASPAEPVAGGEWEETCRPAQYATTWYLAEGCTAGDFETWILVQNPGPFPVDIEMDFMTGEGQTAGPRESVPALSRRSYDAGLYVDSYDVSTRVTSLGGDIVCERAMYGNGRTWAHDSIGVTEPANVWYLAEGCTAGDFETWVLVQNPGDAQVDIEMDFQTDLGEVTGPRETLPPRSRRSYNVGDWTVTYDVSTRVFSRGGGVICERAMYGGNRTWGHDSIGAVTAGAIWGLAEGCTAGGFETWVLAQNPRDTEVGVYMLFSTDAGMIISPRESIAPNSRRSFNVGDYVTSYNVSTVVVAEGGEVICERAMYGNGRIWGHDCVGATGSATTWYLAEGCTAGDFETWVLVLNVSDRPAEIEMTFLTESGAVSGPGDTVPPMSRRSYSVDEYVTSWDVSTRVHDPAGGIICERAVYGGNRAWGTVSLGWHP